MSSHSPRPDPLIPDQKAHLHLADQQFSSSYSCSSAPASVAIPRRLESLDQRSLLQHRRCISLVSKDIRGSQGPPLNTDVFPVDSGNISSISKDLAFSFASGSHSSPKAGLDAPAVAGSVPTVSVISPSGKISAADEGFTEPQSKLSVDETSHSLSRESSSFIKSSEIGGTVPPTVTAYGLPVGTSNPANFAGIFSWLMPIAARGQSAHSETLRQRTAYRACVSFKSAAIAISLVIGCFCLLIMPGIKVSSIYETHK
ncbi:hypothetical protein SK128_025615 [Halocaridina rubra]|uniref:Uncharacterized protein n=1 Tax=Halocaridina rubra TaxID=373956 RepID=A0AAN9A2C9_HALRR